MVLNGSDLAAILVKLEVMAAIENIKKRIEDESLQLLFKSIADSIRSENVFQSQTLPLHYADIFWFYLYLSQLSIAEPFVKIKEYLEWREQLIEKSAPVALDQLLGCNVMNVYPLIPECHFGYDRDRRPVIYYMFGRQNITQALKIINRKRMLDYHLWQNDALVELFYHRAVKTGEVISSSTLVIDADGMSSDTITPDFLYILNRRADITGKYFPYMFDKMIVINAPTADIKLINILKTFCNTSSPCGNVYMTGKSKHTGL